MTLVYIYIYMCVCVCLSNRIRLLSYINYIIEDTTMEWNFIINFEDSPTFLECMMFYIDCFVFIRIAFSIWTLIVQYKKFSIAVKYLWKCYDIVWCVD